MAQETPRNPRAERSVSPPLCLSRVKNMTADKKKESRGKAFPRSVCANVEIRECLLFLRVGKFGTGANLGNGTLLSALLFLDLITSVNQALTYHEKRRRRSREEEGGTEIGITRGGEVEGRMMIISTEGVDAEMKFAMITRVAANTIGASWKVSLQIVFYEEQVSLSPCIWLFRREDQRGQKRWDLRSRGGEGRLRDGASSTVRLAGMQVTLPALNSLVSK